MTKNCGGRDIILMLTDVFQQVVLYAYLIFNVLYRGLPVGSIAIFISTVGQFSGTLSSVFNAYLYLESESFRIQELMDFMDMSSDTVQTGDITPVFDKNSVIEFRNVSFAYPGTERYILKNLNLSLRGDEKLCIVGVNGAGKSTFIKLLTRLYNPTEGEILLNGINIKEYDYDKYQRMFAPVLQNYAIYYFSLGENIVLANEYDKERVQDV